MRKNTTVSGCKEPPAKMKGKGKLHDLMRWQRDVLVHGGALKTFLSAQMACIIAHFLPRPTMSLEMGEGGAICWRCGGAYLSSSSLESFSVRGKRERVMERKDEKERSKRLLFPLPELMR